jgi:LysR family transcriptional regulator, glycine cleavage system transcriptional activator
VVPERFARTAVRAGRVSLALAQAFPMRQAHYLLRPLGNPTPSAQARAFLLWLARLDDHSPALPLAGDGG